MEDQTLSNDQLGADSCVLVVDDNPVDRELVARLVRKRYSVLEASTAQQGLKITQTAQPVCVIVDYNLLGEDGSPVVQQLIREQTVAVILLTRQGDEATGLQAVKQGAQDYLSKNELTEELLCRSIRYAVERRRLELQMRAAQRMEAVGRLAGGVAHDFNNILTVIMSYSFFLQDRLESDEAASSDVKVILDAANRASRVTNQLLAFSRQQARKLGVVSLNHTVAELDKMLRRLLGEDIELVTHAAPDLGMVKTDTTQIEQVLMNLAVNARDAMPSGGKLTIETANVELDGLYGDRRHVSVPPGPYVMIAVTDTGCGIDDATKAHIFEPFFTTKGKGKGTGLGLSTVYGIVKQNGGYIWIYSEPEHGTTFKIYLPRVDEPETNLRDRRSSDVIGGDETILLVEDDDVVREAATQILRERGYTVLPTRNGSHALQVAEQHGGPIDLLITDVVMPELGGDALATQLAAVHPETRVVFMSGYTDNTVVHKGLVDGRSDYLQKPFTPALLLEKVRNVLDDPPAAAAT